MENRDKISRISDIPRDDWGLITGATPVAEVRLSISEVLSIVVLLPISSLVSTFVCLVKVGGLEPEHRGSSPGSDRTIGYNVHVDTGPLKVSCQKYTAYYCLAAKQPEHETNHSLPQMFTTTERLHGTMQLKSKFTEIFRSVLRIIKSSICTLFSFTISDG
jgi:hypothetical protein